jgi:hypothetical protein
VILTFRMSSLEISLGLKFCDFSKFRTQKRIV